MIRAMITERLLYKTSKSSLEGETRRCWEHWILLLFTFCS